MKKIILVTIVGLIFLVIYKKSQANRIKYKELSNYIFQNNYTGACLIKNREEFCKMFIKAPLMYDKNKTIDFKK